MAANVHYYVLTGWDERKTQQRSALDVQRGRHVIIHYHGLTDQCGERCVTKP